MNADTMTVEQMQERIRTLEGIARTARSLLSSGVFLKLDETTQDGESVGDAWKGEALRMIERIAAAGVRYG